MGVSGNTGSEREAPGSGGKQNRASSLSWDERLAQARAQRAKILEKLGEDRALPTKKPWEQSARTPPRTLPDIQSLAEKDPEAARKIARERRAEIVAQMSLQAGASAASASSTEIKRGGSPDPERNVLPLFDEATPDGAGILPEETGPVHSPATSSGTTAAAPPHGASVARFASPPQSQSGRMTARWIVLAGAAVLASGLAGYWGATLAVRNALPATEQTTPQG